MYKSKDWKEWHALYDNDGSGLAMRLKLVQGSIKDSLPRTPSSEFYIIDICSGDGRDLLDVLARYPAKDQVYSYLIEQDQRLAEVSELAAFEKNLQNVTVINGDASLMSTYEKMPRADLILLCGVFGNINSDDIRNTIDALPQLSKLGTRVIWTRHLRQPEVVPVIRNLFTANGFNEITYRITDDQSYAIATYEFQGSPKELNSSVQLFTFVK